MSHDIDPCVLCGTETEPRAMQLVEWKEPVGNTIWSHIPACRDRIACRSRVELVLGEPWPLDDWTPAPARPTPEPTPEPAEEVSPWVR